MTMKALNLLTRRNLYYTFLHLVVFGLAVEVLLLSRENAQVRNRIPRAGAEILAEGDKFYFGELEAVFPGTHLDSSGSWQLVFLMSTQCVFCKENLPNWEKLLSQFKNALPIVTISLDAKSSVKRYVNENEFHSAIFVPTDIELFKKKNKAFGVPKTFLRYADGTVLKVWNGKLSSAQLIEVDNLLSKADPTKPLNQ